MESFSKRNILKPDKFSLALHWLDNPIYIMPINLNISLKRKNILFSSITIRGIGDTKEFRMQSWRNDWLSITLVGEKKGMINVARVECFERIVEQMPQKSVPYPSAVAENIFRRNCSKPD